MGATPEPPVLLCGDAAVAVRIDVVDVAVGAGSSQPEGCWQWRSRTSTARRRAPVKRRLRDTPMTRSGPSNTTRSMSASDSSGMTRPGASTVPHGQLADLGECPFADQDGDQRSGLEATGLAGAGAGGHLDEGVGAALADRAHRPVALVIEVQLVFEPFELVEERGAADRVEHGPHFDDAIEGPGRRTCAAFVQPGTFVFGRVGVGALPPVLDHPVGVGEPQHLTLTDEGLFMVGEEVAARPGVGPGQQVDVIRGQGAVRQRRRSVRHGAQVAGPAELDLRRPQ